jgi:DNA-binding SARP family transcriptional activator
MDVTNSHHRLQNIYLLMLDKLMKYCETQALFETGIQYGVRALRCDRAREITYRWLMRLCYLSGDRTGALRYYSRCEEALRTELEVEPTAQTHALWREICADRFPAPSPIVAPETDIEEMLTSQPTSLADILHSCRTLNRVLAEAQVHNQQHIRLLTSRLSYQDVNVSG